MKGKIVLCDSVLSPATFVSLNGAVGVVMNDLGVKDNARSYPLPSSYLDPVDGDNIKTYMDRTRYVSMTQCFHKFDISKYNQVLIDLYMF